MGLQSVVGPHLVFYFFWLQTLCLAIDHYYFILLYYLFFHEYEVMTCHSSDLRSCSAHSLPLHIEAIQVCYHLKVANVQAPNYLKPPGVKPLFLRLMERDLLHGQQGKTVNPAMKMKKIRINANSHNTRENLLEERRKEKDI